MPWLLESQTAGLQSLRLASRVKLWLRTVQIKSNQILKNFYSAPYNNGRERLTKYIGLIIKCEVKYNI